MRVLNNHLFLLMLLGLLLRFCPVASAEGDRNAYVSGMMRKLGRGIANIATSPAEIVRTSSIVGREKGLVAEITVGITQGLWRTVQRAATGRRVAAASLTGRRLAWPTTLLVGRLLRTALVLASRGLVLGRRVLAGCALTTGAALALPRGRCRARPLR